MTDPSIPLTEGVTPTIATPDNCVLEVRTKHEVIPSVACSLCCLLGVVYCFFGYRCFKMVMFLSGLVFGTAVGYLVCLCEQLLNTPLDAETRAGVSLGIGLLAGLVTTLVRCVGLFLTGLHLGLLLSVAALVVAGQCHTAFTPLWVPVGTVLGTSVFFAMLTLCWQRAMTIVATASLGAAVVTACVDYYVEMPALPLRAYAGLQASQQGAMCWFTWAMLGLWPLLATLGILVQIKFTARGISHSKVTLSNKHKWGRRKEAGLHAEGRSQRRPPPLKRYAGDVLAPSYLASLRERQMSTGSSMSSLSTVYHTMIDFDFETGSMVPLATSPSAARRM
ncbi:transmembrane protein 198-like [Brachyhypopomus gauderio]|uniref:transmembrane protein 198-like n=1 Tax=Brachyhypopomus gauderio TaxID=698409 RepID=UPI004042F304